MILVTAGARYSDVAHKNAIREQNRSTPRARQRKAFRP